MKQSRTKGDLDVGTKTIGVALSDALGMAAHPLVTLPRAGTTADFSAVAELVRDNEVEAVVVGLPLELSGKEGPRARRVRVLIEALREHCQRIIRPTAELN